MTTPSNREPLWRKTSYRHYTLDPTLKFWLFDQGSLTQKLITLSNKQFRVQVLQQKIERAQFSEYRALKLNNRRWAVIREVMLYGNDTPWVYARTIIPLSTLKGKLRRLHYLGSRPLGGALFADPSMRRKTVEIASVSAQHLPTKAKGVQPLWGRRSLFILKDKPLLVGEIFLEELISLKA
ncbi:MAG: chorismate--pyruvate lyase family protein [Cellvibrionaceae bacterium]